MLANRKTRLNVTLKILLNIKIGSDCISCFIYIYASNIRCNIHFMFGCIFPSFSFNKKSILFYLWIKDNITYHVIDRIYRISLYEVSVPANIFRYREHICLSFFKYFHNEGHAMSSGHVLCILCIMKTVMSTWHV